MPLFELRNLTKMKDTTQNSSSALKPLNRIWWNFVVMMDIICRYSFFRKCWFDHLRSKLYPFWNLAKIILCNSNETGFLFDCPSLMLGITIRCMQWWSVGYVSLITPSFISNNITHIMSTPVIWTHRAEYADNFAIAPCNLYY